MTHDNEYSKFARALLRWHSTQGRHNLPWQKKQTAYRVWLSEIMLQQTQVKTAIPYFNKFVAKYQTIGDLANADIDEILKLWEGLGYYSRARNLYKTALIVSSDFAGRFPKTIHGLMSLPGIGRSTAGAILSLAFQIPTAILDGNVKRVLTRYHAITGWPGDAKTEKKLWAFAEEYTPSIHIRNYTQAIMDLGATLCTRSSPSCSKCPLNSDCVAYNNGIVSKFPEKKVKKIKQQDLYLCVITNQKNEVVLVQRAAKGIWGGLWCFPEKTDDTGVDTLLESLGIGKAKKIKQLTPFNHKLSHINFKILPILVSVTNQKKISSNCIWQSLTEDWRVGVPKPVTKIIDILVGCKPKLLQ